MALKEKLLGVGIFAGGAVAVALLISELAGYSPAELRLIVLGYFLGLMSALLSLQALWLFREWRRARRESVAGDA